MFSRSEEVKVEKTVFSVRDLTDDTVTLRAGRPALLLSSTSWTGERRRQKDGLLSKTEHFVYPSDELQISCWINAEVSRQHDQQRKNSTKSTNLVMFQLLSCQDLTIFFVIIELNIF